MLQNRDDAASPLGSKRYGRANREGGLGVGVGFRLGSWIYFVCGFWEDGWRAVGWGVGCGGEMAVEMGSIRHGGAEVLHWFQFSYNNKHVGSWSLKARLSLERSGLP